MPKSLLPGRTKSVTNIANWEMRFLLLLFFHLSAMLNRRNLICLLGSCVMPGNLRIKRALREKARLSKHCYNHILLLSDACRHSDQHVPDDFLLSLRSIRRCVPQRRMEDRKAPNALPVKTPWWNSIRQKPTCCWVNWAFYQSDLYTL